MKKFLTVLLVIAVMFTFSFSSAFAAYTATDETKVTLQTEAQKALDAALSNVQTVKTEYFRTYSDSTITATGYTPVKISKDAALTQADAAVALINAAITGAYNQAIIKINGGTFEDPTNDLAAAVEVVKGMINTEYAKYDTAAEFGGVLDGTGSNAKIEDAIDKLVEAQLEVVRAEQLEKLGKAEAVLGNYSTDLPKDANVDTDNNGVADAWKSNYDIVKTFIDNAKDDVNDAVFNKDDKAATATMITTTLPGYTSFITTDKDGKIIVNYNNTADFTVVGKSGAVPTISDDQKTDKTTAELIAYYQAKFEGEVVLQKAYLRKVLSELVASGSYSTEQVKAWNATLADLDSDFAAVLENGKAVIGYAEGDEAAVLAEYNKVTPASKYAYVPDGSGASYTYGPNGAIKAAVDNCDLVAEVKALAESKKALTGVGGEALYDAATLADNLEQDIEDIYTDVVNKIEDTAVYKMAANEDLVKHEMALVLGDKAATKVVLNKVSYPTVDEWKTDYGTSATNTFADKTKADEAKAIIAETKAAIRAAKTVEEVDAAFVDGYNKYDAVATKKALDKYQTAAKKLVEAYEAKLAAALTTKQAEVGSTFAKTYDCNKTTKFVANLSTEYLKTAYDATELEAKYQEALAEINNLKTIAELQAEAKAINDEIISLGKTKLTAADEAAVLALIDREKDFSDYIKLIDANGIYTTYNAATTFKNTMKALVKEELQKAKTAIGTVTLEDEAAINDLVDKADAFYDNYGEVFNLGTLEADLLNAKVKAVNAAIGAINANADPVDVAAVKAAREAYDALAEKAVLVEPAMYTKLISLENLAGANADENAKAYVQDLKIAARSVKTSKGVKVTIKADVQTLLDAGYTVEYKFYRSTKSNAKFGTAKVVKTENTYLNTSGKKGTKYYYKAKLVVKNAAGEVVATTPLTQCLYATRTF